MTEAEWLASNDRGPMLDFVRGTASHRKLRLLACGRCRRILHLMPDKRSQRALDVAERLADGTATDGELYAARNPDWHIPNDRSQSTLLQDPAAAAETSARQALRAVYQHNARWRRQTPVSVEQASQMALMRCIFGNPFLPIAFDPGWRTADVSGLARGIYEERAFDRLPLLADALMDAGCADEQVIGHCRSEGPHVRGCWVVDLVLGKE
jgi:hypothetical protein